MRNKNLFEKKLVQISSILVDLKRMAGDSRETVQSFNKRVTSAEDLVEDLQSMVEQDNSVN